MARWCTALPQNRFVKGQPEHGAELADDLQRLVDETRRQLGRIDVLVCNAASSWHVRWPPTRSCSCSTNLLPA